MFITNSSGYWSFLSADKYIFREFGLSSGRLALIIKSIIVWYIYKIN
eukprot:SAG11_NODE_9223_length_931_cov_2.066106_1_plen_46_part_01